MKSIVGQQGQNNTSFQCRGRSPMCITQVLSATAARSLLSNFLPDPKHELSVVIHLPTRNSNILSGFALQSPYQVIYFV